MPIENPKEALDECLEQVEAGAVLRVDADALDLLKTQCIDDFYRNLHGNLDAWKTEGPLVRRMAWWVGTVARLFAESNGHTTVNKDAASDALAVVRAICNVRLAALRKYCESANVPMPF